jgi:hypothetical protein
MVADGITGFAQGHNFGVGRGIRVGKVTVPASPDDATITNDHGSDRYLASLQGALRAPESLQHPEFICAGALSISWDVVLRDCFCTRHSGPQSFSVPIIRHNPG